MPDPAPQPPVKPHRVICYVDGFNLYHGLRDLKNKQFYWLDLWALASCFLGNNQSLSKVIYCTSKLKGYQEKAGRQSEYINALIAYNQSLDRDFEIVYGHFIVGKADCKLCKRQYTSHEEKKTDVNIACRLLMDALDDRFDTAFVISADSDLVPPVEIVRERFKKDVLVLFPPHKKSDDLCAASGRKFKFIDPTSLRASMLPEQVRRTETKVSVRPKEWS